MLEMGSITRDSQHAALAMPKLLLCHLQQCHHARLSQHLDLHQDPLALCIIFPIDKHHRNIPFGDLPSVTTSGTDVPWAANGLGASLP